VWQGGHIHTNASAAAADRDANACANFDVNAYAASHADESRASGGLPTPA
jgi:hypothetical protein